jgi:L-threonylcarbamoyladenylate synthase
MMEVHYAPRASVFLISPVEVCSSKRVDAYECGLIVAGQNIPYVHRAYGERVDWSDPGVAAHELYATLHSWDERSIRRIDVVLPPDVDEWRAVRDRLWRASRHWTRGGLREGG